MIDNDVVKGVRARHVSARPKPGIDPAWANAEVDIGFLLKEYDWMRLDRDGHSKIAAVAMDRISRLETVLTLTHSILATIVNAGLTFDGGVGSKFLSEIRAAEKAACSALQNRDEHGG